MIKCGSLNLSTIWNFLIRKCLQLILTSFGTLKYDFLIKTELSFMFLSSSSVAIEFLITS